MRERAVSERPNSCAARKSGERAEREWKERAVCCAAHMPQGEACVGSERGVRRGGERERGL